MESAIRQVALAPRLSHSRLLLAEALKMLHEHAADKTAGASPDNCRTIIYCIEALARAGRILERIDGMDQIPRSVPPVILVLRDAGARLSPVLPRCSDTLCEAAVHLGSVSVDSAFLAGADIKYPGTASSDILRGAEASAERKLNKLYPGRGQQR